MPDPFANARPYYDVTFPNSGDGFSIAGMKNSLQGLGFLDAIPLQPRAHNPADTKILVRGRDASNFYNPVYYGNADQRIPFASGDSAAFSAPASNPRIDIVYMTPSGDLIIQQGTEAANPSLPSLGPSGDSRFPVCAVWNRVGQTKIVNFEDKDSNTGDGYIYQDLRPFIRTAGAGSSSLTGLNPLSATGDNAVGTANTAARADHTHQGVHAIRKVGSANLYGDIEFEGVNQSGNRLIVSAVSAASQSEMEAASITDKFATPGRTQYHPGVAKAWISYGGATPTTIVSYNVDASITDTGAGDSTISFTTDFSTANFVAVGTVTEDPGTRKAAIQFQTKAAGTLRVLVLEALATLVDVVDINVVAFGDQ